MCGARAGLLLTAAQFFGDIHSYIVDLEHKLVREMEGGVLRFEMSLLAVSRCLGELDAFLSLSEFANRFNLCRPELVEDGELLIRVRTVAAGAVRGAWGS